MAAELGHILIFKTLLRDPRVNPEDTDMFGDTILHAAAKEGQYELCLYILYKFPQLLNRVNFYN